VDRAQWYVDVKIAADLSAETRQALVAGSNLLLSPELSLYLANLNMLSPDGICWSYDQRANGYSRGEGIIVLVLKTLSSAISAGDNIRAVMPGAGSNQDGRTPGLTQPSASSQEALIRSVYRSANLGFENTRYVEGHGEYVGLIRALCEADLYQGLERRLETQPKSKP
jgi:acyl transferase domain-containing protein